ncbi:MAG: hypothetical protein HRT99_01060 [Mycoplasmatales bacterium]|nr:hypothetical protein [Mycoplasmatales bacterium]
MKNTKKIGLGLVSIAAVAVPILTVISCGDDENKDEYVYSVEGNTYESKAKAEEAVDKLLEKQKVYLDSSGEEHETKDEAIDADFLNEVEMVLVDDSTNTDKDSVLDISSVAESTKTKKMVYVLINDSNKTYTSFKEAEKAWLEMHPNKVDADTMLDLSAAPKEADVTAVKALVKSNAELLSFDTDKDHDKVDKSMAPGAENITSAKALVTSDDELKQAAAAKQDDSLPPKDADVTAVKALVANDSAALNIATLTTKTKVAWDALVDANKSTLGALKSFVSTHPSLTAPTYQNNVEAVQAGKYSELGKTYATKAEFDKAIEDAASLTAIEAIFAKDASIPTDTLFSNWKNNAGGQKSGALANLGKKYATKEAWDSAVDKHKKTLRDLKYLVDAAHSIDSNLSFSAWTNNNLAVKNTKLPWKEFDKRFIKGDQVITEGAVFNDSWKVSGASKFFFFGKDKKKSSAKLDLIKAEFKNAKKDEEKYKEKDSKERYQLKKDATKKYASKQKAYDMLISVSLPSKTDSSTSIYL